MSIQQRQIEHAAIPGSAENGIGFGYGFSECIGRVIYALQEIIDASPVTIDTPAELSRVFQVDRSLGWRVWSAATSRSLEDSAYVLCGANALERFARAAFRLGVNADLCDELVQSSEAFESWITCYAGDRITLRYMLRPWGETRSDGEPRLSKERFDAERARVGCFAQTLASSVFFTEQPSGDVGVATVATAEGVQALRHLSVCPVASMQPSASGSGVRLESQGSVRVLQTTHNSGSDLRWTSCDPETDRAYLLGAEGIDLSLIHISEPTRPY